MGWSDLLPPESSGVNVYAGKVVSTAVVLEDLVTVVIPAFGRDHEWESVPWSPRVVPVPAPVATGDPIGTISITSAGIPVGSVVANGAAFAKASYPEAYAVAVAEVGAGNPQWAVNASAETFTVPNYSDRFLLAPGARAVGARGGEAAHWLTTAEMPSHTHSLGWDAGGTGYGGTYQQSTNGVVTSVTHEAGGSGAHNNMPPYVVTAFIVKLSAPPAGEDLTVWEADFPSRGDRCIVAFADTEDVGQPEIWIIGWWPYDL